MIEFEKALSDILKHTKELTTEHVPLGDSVGRTLMEDIYSKIDMPPFNKSAMDGYTLKAADAKEIPAKLKSIGSIQAGQTFLKKVKFGECAKIMTGAGLPKDTNSVVMVENTQQFEDRVKITKGVKKWENVCFKGEDIKRGQKVLGKGMVISTSDVALLATVGKDFVKVTRKPKVAVLNTGGEIIPLGRKLGKGKIYNSNGPQLLTLLKSDRISSRYLGIAKDRPEALTKAIQEGLKYDILLVSGGVSMGDYDIVPDILENLKVKKIFHKVNIKPGKPLFFGTRGGGIVFGIPGNPVSNFLTYYLFIRPALRKMMGHRMPAPRIEEGILEEAFRRKPGRKHFVLVKISNKMNRYYLIPVESHGSADIMSLSRADGFMIVDGNTLSVKAKTRVKFITWKKEEK